MITPSPDRTKCVPSLHLKTSRHEIGRSSCSDALETNSRLCPKSFGSPESFVLKTQPAFRGNYNYLPMSSSFNVLFRWKRTPDFFSRETSSSLSKSSSNRSRSFWLVPFTFLRSGSLSFLICRSPYSHVLRKLIQTLRKLYLLAEARVVPKPGKRCNIFNL